MVPQNTPYSELVRVPRPFHIYVHNSNIVHNQALRLLSIASSRQTFYTLDRQIFHLLPKLR